MATAAALYYFKEKKISKYLSVIEGLC